MPRPLKIFTEAQSCTHCANDLPLEPRPLLQGSRRSRILIIGQAPGQKAHDAGTPWLDASGKRLRAWLGVSDEQFYDPDIFALMPMGFCYPGKTASGKADAPPRPECAPLWHARLIKAMPDVQLTLLLGQYALAQYRPNTYETTTAVVRDYKNLLAQNLIALPHPSPRNNRWLTKNPWFQTRTVPVLRKRVASLLQS